MTLTLHNTDTNTQDISTKIQTNPTQIEKCVQKGVAYFLSHFFMFVSVLLVSVNVNAYAMFVSVLSRVVACVCMYLKRKKLIPLYFKTVWEKLYPSAEEEISLFRESNLNRNPILSPKDSNFFNISTQRERITFHLTDFFGKGVAELDEYEQGRKKTQRRTIFPNLLNTDSQRHGHRQRQHRHVLFSVSISVKSVKNDFCWVFSLLLPPSTLQHTCRFCPYVKRKLIFA